MFAREQQIHLGAGLVGTLVAGLLSLAGLAVPMVISGLGFLALTVWLLRRMPERNFTPTPLDRRETFRHMGTTFRAGLRLAAARPVVRGLLLVTVLAGLASEAFDRLWLVRILEDFPLPRLFGADNVGLWFAGFSLVGSVVALVASLLVNRRGAAGITIRHPGGCWPRWPPCTCSASWPSRSAARSGWSWPGSGCAVRRTPWPRRWRRPG